MEILVHATKKRKKTLRLISTTSHRFSSFQSIKTLRCGDRRHKKSHVRTEEEGEEEGREGGGERGGGLRRVIKTSLLDCCACDKATFRSVEKRWIDGSKIEMERDANTQPKAP